MSKKRYIAVLVVLAVFASAMAYYNGKSYQLPFTAQEVTSVAFYNEAEQSRKDLSEPEDCAAVVNTLARLRIHERIKEDEVPVKGAVTYDLAITLADDTQWTCTYIDEGNSRGRYGDGVVCSHVAGIDMGKLWQQLEVPAVPAKAADEITVPQLS